MNQPSTSVFHDVPSNIKAQLTHFKETACDKEMKVHADEEIIIKGKDDVIGDDDFIVETKKNDESTCNI